MIKVEKDTGKVHKKGQSSNITFMRMNCPQLTFIGTHTRIHLV